MKQIIRLASLTGAVIAVLIACSDSASPDPFVPQLLSPEAGAMLDNGCPTGSDSIVWNFQWSAVDGATAYELYVSNLTSIFAQIDDSTLTTTSYHYSQPTFTNSTAGWNWWVRAKVNGEYKNWAGPQSFTVEAANTDCS